LTGETNGKKVIRFITEFCLTPEGAHVGKPFELAEFQKKFILEIYDNPHGTRRAILSIARKNGKSGLIAALLLAHIIGPMRKQNSQIVSGAMSRDQAALVYSLADKMLAMQPKFAGLYKSIPSSKRIVGLKANVEYRALAADGTTAHGLSPILAILDETAQIKGPMTPFVEAITTSQGAHDHPLLITISTQAASDADMLSLWIDDARRASDPHTVCHVYEADKDCDLLDSTQWNKANPALGIFRSEKDLEEQLKQASRIPSMEASVRNLLLNQRIALESLWLAPKIWKENSGLPDLDLFKDGRTVVVGLDLSQKTDLTAAVLAAQDDNGVIHLLPFVFAPEKGMDERELRDRAPYTTWARDGQLIAVPGATLDYDWVFDWLRIKLDSMGITPDVVAFDRWRIKEAQSAADRVGFFVPNWMEVGQGYQSMSPRIEHFETKLLQGKIKHGAHPLLNMAAANCIVVQDPSGNRKPEKAKSTQRIDPLVASLMAAGFFMAESKIDIGAWIA
jgi:phage terminase large subunit-like protein